MLETVLAELRALRVEVAELRAARHKATHDPQPDWEIKSAYTYREAADIWGIGYRTVQGYVSAGKVLTIRQGGPKIPHDEVLRVWTRGVRRKRRSR